MSYSPIHSSNSTPSLARNYFHSFSLWYRHVTTGLCVDECEYIDSTQKPKETTKSNVFWRRSDSSAVIGNLALEALNAGSER